MKVLLFACQQIGVDFINYLTSLKDIEIPLVVSYELPIDKTYGYDSVLEKAHKKGLELRNPSRVNERLISEIRDINPDIIFSVYYRKIFPKSLLSIPRLGCVNVHPSLLPRYRGPTPTAWAILNNETKTGITIHYMDEDIDTGDILAQEEFAINSNETGYELYTKAMTIGFQLLKKSFYKIINRQLSPRKQSGIGSYYGKLSAKHKIDWRQKTENIKNLVRVHAKPYNPVEALLINRYLLVNKVSILKEGKYTLQGAGIITDILDNKRLVVSCADGYLILEDYEIVPKLTSIEKKIYLKVGNKFH